MTKHDRRAQIVAAILAALAGYTDAVGYMASGGFFVSFMSGNSTRFGIGMASGSMVGIIAAGLIMAFLLGVIIGALAGQTSPGRKRAIVLALVALALLLSVGLNVLGFAAAALASTAFAMGTVNNAFERNGEVSIGVSYMTGSLVKLGQRIAALILGTDRTGWIPYFALWLSFVAGTIIGAAVYPHIGLAGVGVGALVAAILAVDAFMQHE